MFNNDRDTLFDDCSNWKLYLLIGILAIIIILTGLYALILNKVHTFTRDCSLQVEELTTQVHVQHAPEYTQGEDIVAYAIVKSTSEEGFSDDDDK